MTASPATPRTRIVGGQRRRFSAYSVTQGVRVKRPPCPKCGELMRAHARTALGRKIRWACLRRDGARGTVMCYSTTDPERAARNRTGERPGTRRPRVFRRQLRDDAEVYIITAAQNATPIHTVFWGCLQQIVKHRRAERMVIPLRYKNPTSRWTASQANAEYWAKEVQPFLWNQRTPLNQNLVVLGDIKIQPTATRPTTGFDAITGGSSAILGHTKMQLRTVAVPSGRMAKILTTTGACTVPNYTDSAAGAKGKFHHTIAALIVEIQGKKFHLRQLYFDSRTQSVTDLDTRYYETRRVRAPRALALVMGDTHVDAISPAVERATFGSRGIVETLRPRRLYWHDLLDNYLINPHHAGKPFIAIAKAMSGLGTVENEATRACQYVRERTKGDVVSVIVPSNHNQFLARWMDSHDWKADPASAEFYLATALEMVRATRFQKGFGAVVPDPFLQLFPKVVDTTNIDLLIGKRSSVVAGIELYMHGHRGPKGSRGSIMNHRRLGVRSIIGHSHSLGIEEGTMQIGTSTELEQEYTWGAPVDWLNAHGVINADGKRQLIIITDGEFRTGRGG